LNALKTERAQAEVDARRAMAGLADAVAGATFDPQAASDAATVRVRSAERLRDAVLKALADLHALLDPDQRARLAYLTRTGTLQVGARGPAHARGAAGGLRRRRVAPAPPVPLEVRLPTAVAARYRSVPRSGGRDGRRGVTRRCRSSTCTCTRSTRCSTGRTRSRSSCRGCGPPGWTPAPSPTTATCSAPSSSSPRHRRRA